MLTARLPVCLIFQIECLLALHYGRMDMQTYPRMSIGFECFEGRETEIQIVGDEAKSQTLSSYVKILMMFDENVPYRFSYLLRIHFTICLFISKHIVI